jgi:alpha-methylacyl-CoA racemase
LPGQHDRARWPELREAFRTCFKSKTRDEWCAVFEGSDACFAPVLSFSEARAHPHARHRNSYLDEDHVPQPAPAPRLSRTPGGVRCPPPERGAGGAEALRDWGFGKDDLDRLRSRGLRFRET